MTDLLSLCKENLKKAIQRCIELKGLKNNFIIEIDDNIYQHINSRGKVTLYTGFYGFNKYKNWYEKNKDKEKKYYKVNGFYIVELSTK